MGTNQKEDGPVKTAHREIEATLTGCIRMLKGIINTWMLTVITTQLNTLKGSRL